MGNDERIKEPVKEGVRINKFLSEAGVCSRRVADAEIAAGRVTIDGRMAQPGDRVCPGMQVSFCGNPVTREEEAVLIAFHKPVGIVCTAEKREKDNIIDYINYPKRIYPMGRLDKDSEGLILLTNQGDLVNRILRAGNYHEKEYQVTVDQDLTKEFLDQLRRGVFLPELGVTTRTCKVQRLGRRRFSIILTQGYNRQIRRMCEACGFRVRRLIRVRIMNIQLGDLPVGTYRNLTEEETAKLYQQIRHSYSAPKGGRRQGRDADKG